EPRAREAARGRRHRLLARRRGRSLCGRGAGEPAGVSGRGAALHFHQLVRAPASARRASRRCGGDRGRRAVRGRARLRAPQVRALLASARRRRRGPGASADLRALRGEPGRGRVAQGGLMRPLWWGGAAAVVALDQLSKWLALAFLTGKGPVGILPCLNFTLVYHRGAAFGFLGQASGWQNAFFMVVALLASAYVIYLLRRLERDNRWTAAGLVLILGGALGNL